LLEGFLVALVVAGDWVVALWMVLGEVVRPVWVVVEKMRSLATCVGITISVWVGVDLRTLVEIGWALLVVAGGLLRLCLVWLLLVVVRLLSEKFRILLGRAHQISIVRQAWFLVGVLMIGGGIHEWVIITTIHWLT
jgi:hypothetical protein